MTIKELDKVFGVRIVANPCETKELQPGSVKKEKTLKVVLMPKVLLPTAEKTQDQNYKWL